MPEGRGTIVDPHLQFVRWVQNKYKWVDRRKDTLPTLEWFMPTPELQHDSPERYQPAVHNHFHAVHFHIQANVQRMLNKVQAPSFSDERSRFPAGLSSPVLKQRPPFELTYHSRSEPGSQEVSQRMENSPILPQRGKLGTIQARPSLVEAQVRAIPHQSMVLASSRVRPAPSTVHEQLLTLHKVNATRSTEERVTQPRTIHLTHFPNHPGTSETEPLETSSLVSQRNLRNASLVHRHANPNSATVPLSEASSLPELVMLQPRVPETTPQQHANRAKTVQGAEMALPSPELSQNTQLPPVAQALTRSEVQQISDQVYQEIERRLIIEKQRIGL